MKKLLKKMDILTVIAVCVAAIAISMMNFHDLSWSKNYKSYMGVIFVVILLLLRYVAKYQQER